MKEAVHFSLWHRNIHIAKVMWVPIKETSQLNCFENYELKLCDYSCLAIAEL